MGFLSRLSVRTAVSLVFAFAVVSCGGANDSNPVPPAVKAQGARKLGIHLTQAQTEVANYDTTFNLVTAAKLDHINMHQIWGDGGLSGLPVAPFATNAAGTTFDFAILDIANAYYPAHSMPVMLTVGVIDTNNKFVPANFNSTAFNDPAFISAFNAMLDQMVTHASNINFVSIQLGNEVDVFLGTDATLWAQYKTFFDATTVHLKSLMPNVKVGVTATLYGAIDPAKSTYLQNLNANADFVSLTYYPVNADFSVKSPAIVSSDIASVIAMYPSKPIYFQEVGYPSGSSYIASSQEKQREFVANFFTAWDQYADNIPVVSWLNFTEWPPATVDGYGTQYGICPGAYCNAFKEYLQTLGLRLYSDGAAKPAWTEMQSQMTARSWQ